MNWPGNDGTVGGATDGRTRHRPLNKAHRRLQTRRGALVRGDHSAGKTLMGLPGARPAPRLQTDERCPLIHREQCFGSPLRSDRRLLG